MNALKKKHNTVKGAIVCITLLLMLVSGMMSCKKEDVVGDASSLTRVYCNEPDAINYNDNFPGKPDNTTCFFPTQIFRGEYLLQDSIYDGDNKLRKELSFPITLTAVSNTKMSLSGFCTSGSINLSADRFYKATVDSSMVTVSNIDYNINGQFLCRQTDTITGYMLKNKFDSTKLTIFFIVASDTGLSYHKGTAKKM